MRALVFINFARISIHALLAESDVFSLYGVFYVCIFLSTLSLRRATHQRKQKDGTQQFLSTLSLRRATRHKTAKLIINVNFYPRSPCGERLNINRPTITIMQFLSTLSLRRATSRTENEGPSFWISIHALLAESDIISIALLTPQTRFLSTLSLRRATQTKAFKVATLRISIHALLAESDAFLPADRMSHQEFLSTLSLRRATTSDYPASCRIRFLSTLSLRRATFQLDVMITTFYYFYPRSPCGERHTPIKAYNIIKDFYPRSPCGERRAPRITPTASRNFYPRSPCGERQLASYSRR